MDCCRHVNPFRSCAGLRGLGYLMVAIVLAIVAASYYAVVVYAWGPTLRGGGADAAGAAAVLAAFHLLLALILCCYLMVVFTDPGSVPENWRLDAEDSGDPASSTSEDQGTAPRYCTCCQNGKPLRCHHCSVCDRCVLKMDHHCIWVVNCVGARNYKYFLLFVVYTFLETVLDTLVLLPYFIEYFQDGSRHSTSSPGNIAILFLAFVLNFAFALSLLCFIGMHTSLVLSNTTSVEVHERRKSVAWKYDVGWKRNLEQVFGSKKLLWFFPLYSTEDLHNIPALRGLEFPTRSDSIRNHELTGDRKKSNPGSNRSQAIAGHDPKDDVDRFFACFKCGVSPPQSAFRERPLQRGKKPRVSPVSKSDGGGSSSKSAPTPVTEAKHGAPSSAAIKFTGRQQMTPMVFYGSPQGVPLKKPLSLLRLLREIRIDLKKQTESIPRDVWATFPRQEETIRFSKAHTHTNVFSYQDHLTGTRRFLVSTYDEFWRRYKDMDTKIHHHYEVIQESSPCHIYFDLEFDTRLNMKRDADEMADILVSVIFSSLRDKYSIEGHEEWITELDSSTEVKFSRHLIIRIPRTAFKDNSHVGAFISEVCSQIAAQHAANPNLNKLYIKKDSSSSGLVDQLFMDTAVYSRNRCFRLAFSSKSGKKSFLVPTGRFKCKEMNDKDMFMESLICQLDDDCDNLLICKLDLECKKTLHFDSEIQERNFKDPIVTYQSDFPRECSYGKSPFPALDNFIESIASFGNVSGKIRSWYWFSQYGLMIYSMSRSRYCEHIGREHKSNHVMYIVDFQRAAYYQKCYDPDCQGYCSPMRAVPWDVIPELNSVLESAQTDYEGKVLEVNIEGSSQNEYVGDGKTIMENDDEDPDWWVEAVKFADSIENIDHAPGLCKLEDGYDDADSDWWMHVGRILDQIESQLVSQTNP